MIKTNITIKDKNKNGITDFIKRMEKMKGAYVSIGVHEDAGTYQSGVSVVQVALWNEFGTEDIPSRPFIRSVIYGEEGKINAWRVELIDKVMQGSMDINKALSALGFRIRELIKNKINSNMPPANAASTVAHKKAAGVAPRTLVETTLLLRSIEYRVVAT